MNEILQRLKEIFIIPRFVLVTLSCLALKLTLGKIFTPLKRRSVWYTVAVMIVLFWEFFLINPNNRLTIEVDRAILYSSVLIGFLLTGGHQNDVFKMFSRRFTRSLYHWRLWSYLWSPYSLIQKLYSIPKSDNAREGVHHRGSFRRQHHHKGFRSHRSRKRLNRTVTLYRKMPLKTMSRIWGKINEKELPKSLRQPLLGLYVWMFGVNLNEAADEDLKNYKNLGEFFRRKLKPHVRTIDYDHSLTSPADGKVLHYGLVENGILEQVKGVTYSLKQFLGPPSWVGYSKEAKDLSEEAYNEKFNIKTGNKLYHCVIYLAPGDYHRFHSPTDWTITFRRHFPGELLSVSPGIARWVEGLFNLNERVVYTGNWVHGFFAYIPVGATNVGSIKIYCDADLVTNTGHKQQDHCYDKCLCSEDNEGLKVKQGEMFGEFNLGSTIVLIFEAPEDFKFRIHNNQKVKFGQALGTCS